MSLIGLYQEMSALTAPECAHSCRVPHSCCSPEYCDMAQEWTLSRYGVNLSTMKTTHAKLKFMGQNGCVLSPHYRPICTMHTCDINGLGFKKNDKGGVWTEKYFNLREQIEVLEAEVEEVL